MSDKGHCKHGEFNLMEGCSQCVAEKRAGEQQPASGSLAEATIAEVTFTMEPIDTKINLCGSCTKFKDLFPECSGDDVLFGDGYGNDNIYKCGNFVDGTTDDSLKDETSVALRPGEDLQAHSYFLKAMGLLEYAESRVITTADDLNGATDDLSIIAKLKKVMEAKRKDYLEPLKTQMDAIRATYEYLMEPIISADKITRDKMLAYNAEQDRIRREQEEINAKRLEAAQQEMKLNGELSEPVNLVEVQAKAPTTTKTDMGLAGQRDNWGYEVTDFALLPDDYKMVDTTTLDAVAKKNHDKKQIPGVRFFNKPIIQVRAR